MNCDNDFNIFYNNTQVKVKPFCESADLHYKVYLPQGELKVEPHTEEGGRTYWTEYSKGETVLANELGMLIDEQQNATTNSVKIPANES